mgnify:FL=1
MRIAETLDDLPIGTPIEIRGGWRGIYRGIVCEHKLNSLQFNPHVVILFSDMRKVYYCESDVAYGNVMILEVK